jgi:hypothetical protein
LGFKGVGSKGVGFKGGGSLAPKYLRIVFFDGLLMYPKIFVRKSNKVDYFIASPLLRALDPVELKAS